MKCFSWFVAAVVLVTLSACGQQPKKQAGGAKASTETSEDDALEIKILRQIRLNATDEHYADMARRKDTLKRGLQLAAR